MESLNDLIWNEEDDDVVDVTSDYLIYIVCLIACQYEGGGDDGGCGLACTFSGVTPALCN